MRRSSESARSSPDSILAAILIARLVPAHRVLAFGPQIFLDRRQRAAVGDERWPGPTRRASTLLDRRYTDLRPVLEGPALGDSPAIEIHYAAEEELDAIHAQHLAGLSTVELVPHDVGADGHALPRILKEQDRLGAVVSEVLS